MKFQEIKFFQSFVEMIEKEALKKKCSPADLIIHWSKIGKFLSNNSSFSYEQAQEFIFQSDD